MERFKSLLTAKTEQVPLQQCGLDNSGDAPEVTNGDAFFWPVLVMNRGLKGRLDPNAPNWLMLSIPTRVPRGAGWEGGYVEKTINQIRWSNLVKAKVKGHNGCSSPQQPPRTNSSAKTA